MNSQKIKEFVDDNELAMLDDGGISYYIASLIEDHGYKGINAEGTFYSVEDIYRASRIMEILSGEEEWEAV